MARIPGGIKVEKLVSKDQTRPVLAAPAIVEWDGGYALAATDSYKLAVIPLEDGAGCEVGPLDLELVRRAVKSDHAELTSRGGVTTLEEGSGTSTARATEGQFPDPARLMPDAFEGGSIGLNAKFLYELAQGLGSTDGVVKLEFIAGGEGGGFNALRPMRVTVGGKAQGECAGRVGLLMPVRVA